MTPIWFDPAALTVSCGTETAALLAQEYALLKYLYDRRGQVFSREQLLDRVWPDRYPDERTVDDHIYRIRRKLARLPQLAVVTVRGCGYCLRLTEAAAAPNPSVMDEEIRASVQGLFRKYHLLGQGRSMLTLAAQQDALGIEVDAFYAVFLHFIQGDLAWLLRTDEVPPEHRLYWVLLYYSLTADAQASLAMFERALKLDVLPPEQKRELYILNIVDLYADTGRTAQAEARIAVARDVVERDGLAGFAMPVALAELYVRIVKDDLAAAAQSMEALERMLAEAPYLRELGRFHALRAMLLLRSGRMKEAAQAADMGLHVLRQSQNVPLALMSVRQLLRCLDRPPVGAPPGQADGGKRDARRTALKRKLEAERAELDREYGLERLLGEMRAMLDRNLRSGENKGID